MGENKIILQVKSFIYTYMNALCFHKQSVGRRVSFDMIIARYLPIEVVLFHSRICIHHFSALPNVHGFVTVMDTHAHSVFPLTVLSSDEESFALKPLANHSTPHSRPQPTRLPPPSSCNQNPSSTTYHAYAYYPRQTPANSPSCVSQDPSVAPCDTPCAPPNS